VIQQLMPTPKAASNGHQCLFQHHHRSIISGSAIIIGSTTRSICSLFAVQAKDRTPRFSSFFLYYYRPLAQLL
jgi:hypothetical protein